MPKANALKDSLGDLVTTLNLITAQSNAILADSMISQETHSIVISSIQSVNSFINEISKDIDKGKTISDRKLNLYIENLDKFSSSLEGLSNNYREDLKTIKTVKKNSTQIEKDQVKLLNSKKNLIDLGISIESDNVKQIDQAITLNSNNLRGLASASESSERRLPYHREKFEELYKKGFSEALDGVAQNLKSELPKYKQVLQKLQKNMHELFSKFSNNAKDNIGIKNISDPVVEENKNTPKREIKNINGTKSIKWDETHIRSEGEGDKNKPYSKLPSKEREELQTLIEQNQLEAGPLKDLDGKKLNIKAQLAKQPTRSTLKNPNNKAGKYAQTLEASSITDNITSQESNSSSKGSKDKIIKIRGKINKIAKNLKKFLDPDLSDILIKPDGQGVNKPKVVNKPALHNQSKNKLTR